VILGDRRKQSCGIDLPLHLVRHDNATGVWTAIIDGSLVGDTAAVLARVAKAGGQPGTKR